MLLTCTPYGVNTHRLLVRGHRVEGPDTGVYVTADAYRIEPLLVACVLAVDALSAGAVEEMFQGGGDTWNLTLFTCTLDGSNRVTVRCCAV